MLCSLLSATIGHLRTEGAGHKDSLDAITERSSFFSCSQLAFQLNTVGWQLGGPGKVQVVQQIWKVVFLLALWALSAHPLQFSQACICHVFPLSIFGTDLDARNLFSLWDMKHIDVAFAKLQLVLNLQTHVCTCDASSFCCLCQVWSPCPCDVQKHSLP